MGGALDRPLNGKTGFTPLHCAVLAGHEEVCQLLVSQGADVNKLTRNKMRALDFALMSSRPQHGVVRLLLNAGASLNSPREDRIPVLSQVARDSVRMVQLVRLLKLEYTVAQELQCADAGDERRRRATSGPQVL
jgi:hypothetical protein